MSSLCPSLKQKKKRKDGRELEINKPHCVALHLTPTEGTETFGLALLAFMD